VGRTDADNERLSLRTARPDDWWFHVRGQPGSHVVLRARDDAEPDRATLELAAGLAVWHSRMRRGGSTAVTCTRARFVRKPRGAPPGTVEVRRESVVHARPPDDARVESLRRATPSASYNDGHAHRRGDAGREGGRR